MTTNEVVEAIRTVSRDYNHSQQGGSDTETPDLSDIFEPNAYENRIADILENIDEHTAVKILNLMYIRREIEEDEDFSTFYQRMVRVLNQNREHAILKVSEKLPVLDQYLSDALELAKKDRVDIEKL
ncbi:TPA: hypothetical protein ACKR0T_000365 [Proteus mirabilis]